MNPLLRRSLQMLPGLLFAVLISGIDFALFPRFLKLFSSNLLLAMPVAFLALGETMIMVTGEVDMSLGPALILVNAVSVAAHSDYGISGPLFLIIGLATGLTIGIIHGLLVSIGRVNSFLATVGTSFVWSGLALLILGEPRGSVPSWFSKIFSTGLAGIPIGLWLLLGSFCIWMLFEFSPLAVKFYAVGSAPRSAFAMGINVNRIKFYAFLLNGLLVGIAGLTITGIIGSGDPRLGSLSTLQAILAALIGGASFAGGTGNGAGAVFAAIGLQFTRNLVAWFGIPHYLLDLTYGGIIVLLIIAISFARRMIESKGM